jgi:hypothetical protein
LQYPSFFFPGTSQYSNEPSPTDLNIKVRINSVNPFNWIKVGNELKKLRPDIIVVRYWLPFMGTMFRNDFEVGQKKSSYKNHMYRRQCFATRKTYGG